MSITGFLLMLVLGAICGYIAERIVGYSPGGWLTSAAIGFVGALLGGWIAGQLHLPSIFAVRVEGRPVEIVWTVLGAIVLLLVVKLTTRSRYYGRR
jgi:uncharacterized membrane protein YeaQ/YmgE (transglycosylase-associated protein family)